MTYILHMMGGRDIEVSDDEYSGIAQAVKDKVGQIVRKSNKEVITLSAISNTEKVFDGIPWDGRTPEQIFIEKREGKRLKNLNKK